MPHTSDYTIRIRTLQNAFTVEVPDMEAIKKKEAEDKKAGREHSSYIGDLTKTFAAKTVAEALKHVKQSLSELPEVAYAEAFSEASKGEKV